MTEDEAFLGAARCLDCGVCSECHACVDACPADAIKLDMVGEEIEAEVGSVVLATGFKLFPADAKPQYGYGRFKNVITGMQMDRLLAPTRPYNAVLRPSDGKVPDNIAYVMCTGSRDETVGNPLCSKICCMYSVKQNQLIMGALPLADVTVYYIDVRSVGKGYDEFYQQAKDMGANFVKGRVSGITETDEGNLVLRYEDIENGGTLAEAEHDMVVLAVGVQPNAEAQHLFVDGALALDDYYYVGEADEDLDPGRTNLPGVFVAGSAAGAKDIPDSILHAGAAVAQAAAHLERAKVKVAGHERPQDRRVRLPVRRQHQRLRRRREGRRGGGARPGRGRSPAPRCSPAPMRPSRRSSRTPTSRGWTRWSSPRARPSCTRSPSATSPSAPA